MTLSKFSLEEITKLGQKIYLEDFKTLFEKNYIGQYAVIDVETKNYKIDADRLIAIEDAKRDFGDKLFYIIQIGNTQNPSTNYSAEKYAWNF